VDLLFLSRQQRSKVLCDFWLHLSEVLCSSHSRTKTVWSDHWTNCKYIL
jgi:hypothetical protein